jgi:competence ComEA-like helix-hairpin-helix protein
MIWRFDFSRRALSWLLGVSFLAGTGLELREQWLGRSATSESRIVSLGIDPVLAHVADSLHQLKVEELKKPIDINTASAEELERLPGVGPVLALRIIDDREEHGPFATVDELDRVSGIGPKKLAAMRERIVVNER